MVNELVSNIPGYGLIANFANANWTAILIWTIIIVIFVFGSLGLLFIIMWRKRFIKIYEIDITNRRLKQYAAKIVRDTKTQSEKLYIPKYKKSIERPQQVDFYYLGKRDALFLVKDNNGLHHTLRMPTKEELVEFFSKVKNIDITKEFNDDQKTENPYFRYYQIYAMPNPHEDLDWLGQQIEDANKEFKPDIKWWQSPTVMVIGTACLCVVMVIVMFVLSRKL